MKDRIRMEIRLPAELKEKFNIWCKTQGTTATDELRRYITQLTKDVEINSLLTEVNFIESKFREKGIIGNRDSLKIADTNQSFL